jgi:DNA polymerase
MKTLQSEFKEIVSLTRKYLQQHNKSRGLNIFFEGQDKEKQRLEGLSLNNVLLSVKDCQNCSLYQSRTNFVFGEGNEKAVLMFIGEAPGYDEDKAGRPFVGKAGQLLTKIIESIDFKREDVYIANILKCRPPENRNPSLDEIEACKNFLFQQIAIIKPKVICALGTFAAQTLLETDEKISRLRGSFYDFKGIKVMPTFHPSYLLRNVNEKRKVWHDMQKIRNFIRE